MIELGVIVALLIYIGWRDYQDRKERKKMINALISKSAQEARDLELADNTKIEVKEPESENPPDLVPMDQLSDDEFASAIESEGSNA